MNREQAERGTKGRVHSVSGSVVIATGLDDVFLSELCCFRDRMVLITNVYVGGTNVAGEVISIHERFATIQMFGEATGFAVGDSVICTGRPLSVELGPGLLDSFFDGLQRQFERPDHDVHMPKLSGINALNKTKQWRFEPLSLSIGDLFSAGDILGAVQETSLFAHKILVPGNLTKPGKLIWLADDGDYTVLDTIAKLEYEHGRVETITMMHTWPVRRPRPIVARVDPDQPLLTGHRVIDGLFPCSLGGTACLPGAQGGKNTVLQSIARFSNTDISIYAACGGRTTDVGESVLSFSQMVVPAGDTDEPLMSRTCVVATSLRDSPAVHEISIYFAMTIAEYYRDQGSNVVFLLDSFYRWGDALRDIRSSGTSSFPPADQVGTPAFLKNTVTSFINRSGKVKCLGSPNRTGSVTLIGVVEPSSDPASEFAVESMQVYWKLDHRLAQKRHFPSINWTQSYSNSVKELEMFYDLELDPDFLILQERITNILKQEPIIIERINASTKIQDELKDEEKALIAASRLLRENFLQQNLFTPYDRYCPLYKTLGLMRVYTAYYDALVRAVTGPCKVSFALLREGLLSLEYKISNAKFADPSQGQEVVETTIKQAIADIESHFNAIV